MLEIVIDFILYMVEYITIVLLGASSAWFFLYQLRKNDFSTQKKLYITTGIVAICTSILIALIYCLDDFEAIIGYYVEWYIIFVWGLILFSSKKMQNTSIKDLIKLMKIH